MTIDRAMGPRTRHCLAKAHGAAFEFLWRQQVNIYQPVKIEGNSMTPMLSNHEAIIINRLVYHVEPIRCGDVVVFRYPLDATKSYIKRIVGLPGETAQSDKVWSMSMEVGFLSLSSYRNTRI